MSSKLLRFLTKINCAITGIYFNGQSAWMQVTIVRDSTDRFVSKVEKGNDPYRALDIAIETALFQACPNWKELWNGVEKSDPITGEVLETAGLLGKGFSRFA